MTILNRIIRIYSCPNTVYACIPFLLIWFELRRPLQIHNNMHAPFKHKYKRFSYYLLQLQLVDKQLENSFVLKKIGRSLKTKVPTNATSFLDLVKTIHPLYFLDISFSNLGLHNAFNGRQINISKINVTFYNTNYTDIDNINFESAVFMY
ncbi:MAG: hypothetical protein EXX96DRAFT_604616 [Benjaminiella poitrasii]|nr:MAG: hypothetical protein EXX96DRAFT_604616 [Benjaminiella poitrasii]